MLHVYWEHWRHSDAVSVIRVTFINKVCTNIRAINIGASNWTTLSRPWTRIRSRGHPSGLTTGINSGFSFLGAPRPNDGTGVRCLLRAGFDCTAGFDFSAGCRGGRRRGRRCRGRGTWYISSPRHWERHSGTVSVAQSGYAAAGGR